MKQESFPAELRELLRLVRCALGTAEGVGFEWRGLQMEEFLRCVRRHRLGAFLHDQVPEEVKAELPEQVRDELERLARENLRRSLSQIAQILDLTERLREQGVGVLSVKGPVMGQELYGKPGVRFSRDIDLLIRPVDFDAAEQILRTQGYVRVHPDFEMTPRQREHFLKLQNGCEYEGRNGMVDLLWRLEDEKDVEAAWSNTSRVEVSGHAVEVLPPAVGVAHFFAHGTRHGWHRLFWIVDAAMLLRRGDVDWEAVLERMEQHPLRRSVQLGARLARDLLGVQLPGTLAAGMRSDREIEWLVRQSYREMTMEPERERVISEWVGSAVYRLRIRPDFRDKAGEFFPPRGVLPLSWKMVRLPDGWYWLYYVIAPLAWLRCRIEGRAGR